MNDQTTDIVNVALEKGGAYAPVAIGFAVALWYMLKTFVNSTDTEKSYLKKQVETLTKQVDDYPNRIQNIYAQQDVFIDKLTSQFNARIDEANKAAADDRERSRSGYEKLATEIAALREQIRAKGI